MSTLDLARNVAIRIVALSILIAFMIALMTSQGLAKQAEDARQANDFAGACFASGGEPDIEITEINGVRVIDVRCEGGDMNDYDCLFWGKEEFCTWLRIFSAQNSEVQEVDEISAIPEATPAAIDTGAVDDTTIIEPAVDSEPVDVEETVVDPTGPDDDDMPEADVDSGDASGEVDDLSSDQPVIVEPAVDANTFAPVQEPIVTFP